MSKSRGQKLKLIYLRRILRERSDEKHPLTMAQLIAALSEYGIAAERKSIYDDIRTLRESGVDVSVSPTRPPGYYIEGRFFDLSELQLMVDSIEAAPFVTEDEAAQLIKKISSLTNQHQAKKLIRPVYIKRQAKSADKHLRQKLDSIFAAISNDCQISFAYRQQLQLDERFTHKISPFALAYSEGKYYLLGYNARRARIEDFSVARMQNLTILELPRSGKELFTGLDIKEYFNRIIL